MTRPDAEAFFRRSALLFATEPVVRAATERIISAQPMIGTLAADPSLRGVAQTLKLVAEGVERGTPGADVAQLAFALTALGDAAEAATAGRIAPLDWSRLFTGRAPEPLALRRFVLVRPALDYSGLAPASAAIATIRDAVARLDLEDEAGVRVRLTGSPVIRDEEFSTVFGGAISENILSLLSVAALLWLGLRSMRLILPMLGVLVLGLAVTAAFGTLFIGPYNPLSIAFAVLFIGLAVDFAIQYSVCLREQRHRLRSEPLASALVTAAAVAGPGIGLAALATLRRLPGLPADRLPRPVRARHHRLGRHADRRRDQPDHPARLAGLHPAAGGAAAGRLCRAGATRPLPDAPGARRRRGDRRPARWPPPPACPSCASTPTH